MSPSFPFQLKTYEETIMNVHERWISDESIFSISTKKIWRDYYECAWTMYNWWVHLFHFNLKYEETIMNVYERWISDESIFSIQTKEYEETIM